MSAVPNDVRERCRTLLLQGMKNVYKDKQEDYLRSLVMRFEQEKLFDMHKDLPSYLANANAKLQQVDKNTALLTVSAPPPAMPVLAMPAASLSPAAEQEYWRVRGELAAKYLPHLRECVTHMNRVRSALSAHHQVTAASLVAHADKVIQVLEQKLNGTLELPKLELNCQKCISAARVTSSPALVPRNVLTCFLRSKSCRLCTRLPPTRATLSRPLLRPLLLLRPLSPPLPPEAEEPETLPRPRRLRRPEHSGRRRECRKRLSGLRWRLLRARNWPRCTRP